MLNVAIDACEVKLIHILVRLIYFLLKILNKKQACVIADCWIIILYYSNGWRPLSSHRFLKQLLFGIQVILLRTWVPIFGNQVKVSRELGELFLLQPENPVLRQNLGSLFVSVFVFYYSPFYVLSLGSSS